MNKDNTSERGAQEPWQSAEFFSRLVASVRDYAVFLLDPDGCVLTWNSGAESIKGYRAEEIIGKHFSCFYPPNSQATGWPEHELRVARETGRFEDEGWRVRRDGSRFWANVVITTLRDESGEVRGFLKITRDLTDRKQAEEKLRLSEERFRLLVEGVRDYAIFGLDPEGKVVTWNLGAERLKGYQASEIIGKHFSTFYPQEALDRDWPAKELQIALEQGRVEDEGWRVRKDGTSFWANVVITALKDENGALQGFSKVTRDLTERKENEEKRRQLAREETARKVAEKAASQLHEQREQLRVTLASIGDGVVVTDSEGRITFLNTVAQNLLGWSLEEAEDRPLEEVFRIYHEDTREIVSNPALKALREKTVVALANHTVLLSKDGREIPIEDSAAPILGPAGELSGAVLVFRDVTEARRSREASLYLAAIVASSDDAIIGKTMDGRIASWNAGAERLYGYTASEVLGRPLSILVPSDRPGELEEVMRKVTDGERIEHFETERIRKDGTRVAVSLTVSPVRNRDGKIIGISKIARDITEQKQHQENILKHSRRFRLLWESAAVLLSTDDPKAMLQDLFSRIGPQLQLDTYFNYLSQDNSRELRLNSYCGLSPEQARSAESVELSQGIFGKVAQTWETAVYSHIQETNDQETELVRGLGLRVCFCNALIAEGRLLGTLAFGSRLKDEFEPYEVDFLSTLSRYVTVAYERLRLVERLREADRRKDHFLATLAHELRNPLAPLRNGLQVMKLAEVQNESILQAHEVMDRQLTHMVRLIDDLLDMSRISRGKITLQRQRLDLSEVVQSAVETSRPVIEAEQHEFIIELSPEPLWVHADITRLAQVVSNLLNNAAKFTPPGGKIWLKTEREGERAVLSVKDTGVGIPTQMLGQVFEVFTQVDSSLERAQGGLGIGLSLVKGLVELHGGTVEVRSGGEGTGTEFLAYLPLAAPREPEGEVEKSGPGHGSAAGLRILVVDDNKDSALTLTMMLKLMKHQVEKAYDGVQAYRTGASYRPDLILMDIGMPEMNGYDACRLIREEDWGKKIAIVALTGWGQEEDKRKSKEAGFDRHLVKPVDPQALEGLLAELFP